LQTNGGDALFHASQDRRHLDSSSRRRPPGRALRLAVIQPIAKKMNVDNDKWRELSQRAGKREHQKRAVRFSRMLLVGGALFLFIIGLFNLL
jgi:hypothetical protein